MNSIDLYDAVWALSPYLLHFRHKSNNPFKINARCDVCGDSRRSSTKTRFWIEETKDRNDLRVKCYNCGLSMPFGAYLRKYHPAIHSTYLLGQYRKTKQTIEYIAPEPVSPPPVTNRYQGLIPASDSTSGLRFLETRQIPKDHWGKLFYTDHFYEYVNRHIPGKFDDWMLKNRDHPRVVIPFLDMFDKVVAFQGRSLGDDNGAKYLTFMLDDVPKIYGLDGIDHTKPRYCVEGPIDSMFIPNCIAMAGSDASPSHEFTIVLDNEPRNPEIVEKYLKFISRGYKICIWPDSIPNGSDINDLILLGYDPSQITSIIDKHTFSGIRARMQYIKWKRV